MSDDILFKAEDLVLLTTKLFVGGGLRQEDAKVIAEDLVAANLRGLDSHGISRVPMYVERIRRGVVNPQPTIFLAGHRAMDEAIALAETSGIGLVGVRRSTHYGMAALYVLQAIQAGYIGLAYTNSSPALPVWGGRTPLLGASPFAAGVPSGNQAPYVLDMAMSVIARGKIRMVLHLPC